MSHVPAVVVVFVASVVVVVVIEEEVDVHVAKAPLMQAVSPANTNSREYAYRTAVQGTKHTSACRVRRECEKFSVESLSCLAVLKHGDIVDGERCSGNSVMQSRDSSEQRYGDEREGSHYC